MTEKAKGSCLCNLIQFEIELPTKWVAHCHCNMCRKSHGAGYVTWVGINNNQFRLITGTNKLIWYHSSKPAQRGFCKNCGSSLFFKSSHWLGEMHIALANFDDPIDKPPQTNAYWSTHVDWMPTDNSLKEVNS